ncbi:hypothetical protein L596_004869 [Steinernema carpocapsae]|uniref:Uncharacterized protein n=1 Tax=Steinernema carpocapsae TaxID=34508 RepID=A0A4U8UX37_STECR|nr:hypothetical protein L596_004869 [Steinernema carpocapsae]
MTDSRTLVAGVPTSGESATRIDTRSPNCNARRGGRVRLLLLNCLSLSSAGWLVATLWPSGLAPGREGQSDAGTLEWLPHPNRHWVIHFIGFCYVVAEGVKAQPVPLLISPRTRFRQLGFASLSPFLILTFTLEK